MATADLGARQDGGVARFEEACKDRLRKLSKVKRNAFAELARLLALTDDESERAEIVDTLVEIVFPEWVLNAEIHDLSDSEEREARERLDDYRMMVGQQIRKRRESLGMNQEELAKLAGLTQSHVSRLEVGKHAPTHVTIERLAKALQTTPSQLDPGFQP